MLAALGAIGKGIAGNLIGKAVSGATGLISKVGQKIRGGLSKIPVIGKIFKKRDPEPAAKPIAQPTYTPQYRSPREAIDDLQQKYSRGMNDAMNFMRRGMQDVRDINRGVMGAMQEGRQMGRDFMRQGREMRDEMRQTWNESRQMGRQMRDEMRQMARDTWNDTRQMGRQMGNEMRQMGHEMRNEWRSFR